MLVTLITRQGTELMDSSVEEDTNWRAAWVISNSTDVSLVAMWFNWARVHRDLRTSIVGNTTHERNLSSLTPVGQYNIS